MSIKTIARSRWGKALAAVILLAGIAIPAVIVTTAHASTPCPSDGLGRDCDANSLIWGGAYSKPEFDTAVYTNDRDLDGHTGLQAMYASLGVSKATFDSADTVQGTVYKDGTVVVNGKVVQSNTWSSGRNYDTGSIAKNAGGTTLYFRPERVSFLSDSIPAWVNMSGGSFHYAVLMSCGNTILSTNTPYGQIFKRVTDVTTDPNNNYAADTQSAAITVHPGDVLKYQVRVDNNGDGDMTNTVMTDNLPAGVALASGGSSAIKVAFNTVPAEKAVEADITVKVTETTAKCIDNVASFTASNGQSGSDHAWICVVPAPTPTPVHTPTPTPVHPTPTPVQPTPTPVHPTPTPTPVHPTPTPTPVHPTPTPTPVHPTPTPTPVPTPTPTPKPTPTPTPVPTPTPTPVHPTPTPTPVPTPTPTPVHPTPTPTPSVTPTPSPTPTPSEEFSCGGLTSTAKSNGSLTYTFTITPNVKNVTVTGYIFVITNAKGEVVKSIMTDAAHNSAEYTLPTAGVYTVTGQVETNRGTTPVVELCTVKFTAGPSVTPTPTPSTPTPTPTPGECEATPAPGETGEVCGAATTPVLPDTGATALGGIGGLGAIGYATRAYLMSKKSVIDSLRNK